MRSRQDYPSTIYEQRKIALFFSSIRLGTLRVDFVFERGTQSEIVPPGIEAPPILIIAAMRIHFHGHDKITNFKEELFSSRMYKILFIQFVTVLKIVNETIVNIFLFLKMFLKRF